MMVDLPEPDDPTSAVTVPRLGLESDIVQHCAAAVVAEVDMIEFQFAENVLQRHCAVGVLIFGAFLQDLLGAFQPGQRFGELGSNGNNLHDRGDQKTQEEGVGEETADSDRARHDLMRAHIHDHSADDAHQKAGGKAHHRRGRERPHHILQQALHSTGEDGLLALLGVISLDHSHTAQRFGKAAGDLSVDFAALPENRPDGCERLIQSDREAQQKTECQHGHERADAKKNDQGDSRCKQAPQPDRPVRSPGGFVLLPRQS